MMVQKNSIELEKIMAWSRRRSKPRWSSSLFRRLRVSFSEGVWI